jgi:hypothetical protein
MAFSISEPVWQEDDVVHALTERWRRVATVLASGGNQGTLHFATASGRRKAPDVVAYCDETVVLVEAKVRAAALFSGIESDLSHLHSLSADPGRCDEFLRKASALLRSMGESGPEEPRLVCALLAGSAFVDEQIAAAEGLACIEAPSDGSVRAVARGALLPHECRSVLD